jgi:2-polyprenyl-3-methyl-5-hydroxy-6-metoxy-1,4-benzoquinol methylase
LTARQPGVALQAEPLAYHADPATTPLSAEKRLVLERVAPGARVLEVGAHGGYFSAALTARGCAVTAVEADPRAAAVAGRYATRVLAGSIEDPAVVAAADGPFDALLFMHVLEHLVDPWAVLRAMHAIAAPGARLLALLPNVACWRVRKALFRGGAFAYEDTGILDRTHLRFFTLDSAAALLDGTGWSVRDVRPVDVCVPLERRLRMSPLARRLAPRWHAWMAGRWPNLCTEIALFEASARDR